MYKFCFILAILFVVSGCASMRYVDPGSNPAHLTVNAKASLDPAWVDDFMNTKVLSVTEQWNVKWIGHLEGPWWAIKVYAHNAKGELAPLRPVSGGIFEGVVTHNFDSSREFIIPPGHYDVEVWLEAYMYYCVGPVKTDCGTPTLRIWKMPLEQKDFAPGSRTSVTLDGTDASKDSAPVSVY